MTKRPEPRPRADFRHFTALATRWGDNDMYGHVNNVQFYAFFDTAVNRYLIEHAALEPMTAPVIGLVVESGCAFFAPLAYPETVEAGIVAARIGESSVRYEIGIFGEGTERAAAQGHFVHVYVDAKSRRPVPLPAPLRAALERIAG
jgi:acyl-CoA thioester hydrolase